VLLEHLLTMRIDLALKDNLGASPLEAEVEPADAREEGRQPHA
jgi:hypothetical protein